MTALVIPRAGSWFTICIRKWLLCFDFHIELIKSVSKKVLIKNFEVNISFSERKSTQNVDKT